SRRVTSSSAAAARRSSGRTAPTWPARSGTRRASSPPSSTRSGFTKSGSASTRPATTTGRTCSGSSGCSALLARPGRDRAELAVEPVEDRPQTDHQVRRRAGAAEHAGPRGIDEVEALQRVVDHGHQVVVVARAPAGAALDRPANGAPPLLAVAGRAARVGVDDDVTRTRIDLELVEEPVAVLR